MPAERLQKILAAAGVASRRKAEDLITAGRVSVNGHVVRELGTKADVEQDRISVDGRPLKGSENKMYLMVHKPKGYVTTVTDPEGRRTIMELVRGINARLYPVGRLDYASEGLVLMTNDGDLAARLMHASSHVPKKYLVKVSGRPSLDAIAKLREGVVLPPRKDADRPSRERRKERTVKTSPAKIDLTHEGDNPWYEVTLIEGRNRQIRRMFEAVGHHVEKIRRVAYGPLELDIEPGVARPLTMGEIAKLKGAARGGKKQVPRVARNDNKNILEARSGVARNDNKNISEARSGFARDANFRKWNDKPKDGGRARRQDHANRRGKKRVDG